MRIVLMSEKMTRFFTRVNMIQDTNHCPTTSDARYMAFTWGIYIFKVLFTDVSFNKNYSSECNPRINKYMMIYMSIYRL